MRRLAVAAAAAAAAAAAQRSHLKERPMCTAHARPSSLSSNFLDAAGFACVPQPRLLSSNALLLVRIACRLLLPPCSVACSLSVCLSMCLCPCLSVCRVVTNACCANTVEPIKVPFTPCARGLRGKRQVVGSYLDMTLPRSRSIFST